MRFVHVLAAVAVAFTASPAAAAVTTIVLTGVASGGDDGHLTAPAPFGTTQLGVDIVTGATTGIVTERAFTLTVRVDESRGTREIFGTGDDLQGVGVQSPVTATFSMNGFSYDFGNAAGGFAKSFLGVDQMYGYAHESRLRPPMTGDFTNVTGALDFNVYTLGDIFQERRFGEPAEWTLGPGDISLGHLTLSLQDTSGTEIVHVLGPVRTADLTLRFDTLSIAAVPEPSTWALLIAGFGLAGAALRRPRLAA